MLTLSFRIQVEMQYRKFSYFIATRVHEDESFEHYRVDGANRYIVLQCNRPMLLAKGLKKKPLQWKLVEGTTHNSNLVQLVGAAIEQYLKQKQFVGGLIQAGSANLVLVIFKQFRGC